MISHETLTHAMQTYQSREEPERLYALAGIYWRLMLLAGALVFCVGIAGGAYLLFTVLFGSNSANTSDLPVSTLNRAQLSSTIQAYEARKALFDELGAGGASIPDPTR